MRHRKYFPQAVALQELLCLIWWRMSALFVLHDSSDMRQSKLKQAVFALRKGPGRHTTAPDILFYIGLTHVRRKLQ